MRRADASSPVRFAAAAAVALGALAMAAAPAAAPAEEVRLHLVLSSRPHGTKAEREALRELQYEIAGRLEAARAGKVARDEWPDGWCVIFVAAPDAAAAWALVEEAVRAFAPRKGSYVVLRRGSGSSEQKVPL